MIGVGLSPRGNDDPGAPSNASTLARALPPRPRRGLPGERPHASRSWTSSPSTRTRLESTIRSRPASSWPNAGLPEPRPDQAGRLGRLPRHRPAALRASATRPCEAAPARSRRGRLADRDPAGADELLHGTENAATTTRRRRPRSTPTCQAGGVRPVGRLLNFFDLVDEADLSLAERPRARRRHAPALVRRGQARDRPDRTATARARRRSGRTRRRSSGPSRSGATLSKPQKSRRSRWSFPAGAGEDATFRAGIFKAGPGPRAILGRRLAAGRPKPVHDGERHVKAKDRVVYVPEYGSSSRAGTSTRSGWSRP